jgi:hypothetical protein
MSASRTAIANRALTKVGAARIIDLTDDTPEGRAVNSMYDIERRALLREYGWNFVTRRCKLPALAEPPDWGYALRYQLPADFIRLIYVGEWYAFPVRRPYVTGPLQPWHVEGGQVFTDQGAPLPIIYIADTEEAQDALFDNALACKLAVELNVPMTEGGTDRRELLLKEFQYAITRAKRAGAIENPPEPIPDDAWIWGRL